MTIATTNTAPLLQNTPASAPTQALPLEDIITPSTVDIWPPAIGWWLLLILIVAVVIRSFVVYRRYQKKWGYRKQGLSLLNDQLKQWEDKQLSAELCCQKFLAILKRCAITAYPDAHIDALYGNEWLERLRIQAPKVKCNDTITSMICYGQYQKNSRLQPKALYDFCRQWICQHDTRWQGENA